MPIKLLEEIKHSDKIMGALSGNELFFNDLHSRTFLDSKTLQRVLGNLQKHGYVHRLANKKWVVSPNSL